MLSFLSTPNVYAVRRKSLLGESALPSGAPAPFADSPSAQEEQQVTLQVDKTYILNIFLNTVLFLFTLISGTACTSAMTAAVGKDLGWRRLAVFAVLFTLMTMGLAIGFAALARRNHDIQIRYLNGMAV